MIPETSASFGRQLSYDAGAVSLSEVISAMTFALDLTEDAVPGHALRSCLLAMRLGQALGLTREQHNNLYYTSLLKDVGCANNAGQAFLISAGGSSSAKPAAFARPQRPDRHTLGTLWRTAKPGANLPRRMAQMVRMGFDQRKSSREAIQLRGERGAQIVRNLEMGNAVIAAVKRLDEHWDGSGYPDGLCGEEIPLLSRVCLVAQTLDAFATEAGHQAAVDLLHQHKGTWFDPQIVQVAARLHGAGELWERCGREATLEDTRRAVLELDPRMMAELVPERVDRLCEAFAGVVDAKSPFTYRHSVGVADVAVEIALEMGLAGERVQMVRRAALLHDIGKLAVPNSILDKAGALTQQEWAVVLEHPGLSRSILQRVASFRELAAVAGEHHEKLDGSGYPWGLTAKHLSLESKLLGVADVFSALAEDRPYRKGLELKTIHSIMSREVPGQLDGECYEALLAASARWSGNRPGATAAEPLDVPHVAAWYPEQEPLRAAS